MPGCAKCGTDFHGKQCPACGEHAPISAMEVNKRLRKYACLSIAGFIGIIVADYSYSLLDESSLSILALCLFSLPVVSHVVTGARKRLPPSFDLLRRMYVYFGSSLILLAGVLILNGLADRGPMRLIQTSITRKYITRGRSSNSYHLVVSSWRPGRDQERLRVDWNGYRSMFVGEAVAVEVHPGLFRLPWYGRILPQ